MSCWLWPPQTTYVQVCLEKISKIHLFYPDQSHGCPSYSSKHAKFLILLWEFLFITLLQNWSKDKMRLYQNSSGSYRCGTIWQTHALSDALHLGEDWRGGSTWALLPKIWLPAWAEVVAWSHLHIMCCHFCFVILAEQGGERGPTCFFPLSLGKAGLKWALPTWTGISPPLLITAPDGETAFLCEIP